MTATDRDDSGTLRAIKQEWLRAIAGIRRQEMFEGATLHPRGKQKETEKLYQNFDPARFEAWSSSAGAQIATPTLTSHDGLFEWSSGDANQIVALASASGGGR